MRSKRKNTLNDSKDIQRYHCIKLLEGMTNNDMELAERHLNKLIDKNLSRKIQSALKNQTLI